MPRRPEIGNIQLYPNRPLKASDKNGYVLKFYCPIQQKRIRKNTGTRNRRDARRILRECRERLLNDDYVTSGGAITKQHEAAVPKSAFPAPATAVEGKSWQECYERYRNNRMKRVRPRSLEDAMLRLNVAERIFEAANDAHRIPEGLPLQHVMTLEMLEYLQDRLLEGDE